MIVIYAITLTMWTMALRADVDKKVDKMEFDTLKADVRDIKAILCQSHPTDSACSPRRP
jgi:hypothetical protein